MDFIATYMKLDNYTKKLVDTIHSKKKPDQYHQLQRIKNNMYHLKIDKKEIEEFIYYIKETHNIRERRCSYEKREKATYKSKYNRYKSSNTR